MCCVVFDRGNERGLDGMGWDGVRIGSSRDWRDWKEGRTRAVMDGCCDVMRSSMMMMMMMRYLLTQMDGDDDDGDGFQR